MTDETNASELVPFGKYKDQPIERLLADRDYCDWLAAQPWFRERYGSVHDIVSGVRDPQDTPEHNAMQARFLDHGQALRLVSPWLTSEVTMRAKWEQRYAAVPSEQQPNLRAGIYKAKITSLRFEDDGWDLMVTGEAQLTTIEEVSECICACGECYGCKHPDRRRSEHCSPACPEGWAADVRRAGRYNDWEESAYGAARFGGYSSATVAVELKPTLGDDYPSVLHAVLKRVRRWFPNGAKLLVVADRAQFEGVTLDQVKRIFGSQGAKLRLSSELVDGMDCSCESCSFPF